MGDEAHGGCSNIPANQNLFWLGSRNSNGADDDGDDADRARGEEYVVGPSKTRAEELLDDWAAEEGQQGAQVAHQVGQNLARIEFRHD